MYLHVHQDLLCTKLVILGGRTARKNRCQGHRMFEETDEMGGGRS
jgi:hypothetical protein